MPAIAIVSAGAVGSAIAKSLVHAGCTVYTNLDGRSPAAHRGEADIFKGFTKVFERVAGSLEGDRKDVETLKTGMEQALELQGMSK